MIKIYFTYILPLIFLILYLIIVLFSLFLPQIEKGAGYLLALVIAFPSSFIVPIFIDSKIPINFIWEGLGGAVQYAIIGICFDYIRSIFLKRGERRDKQFNDLLSTMRRDK